MHIWEFKRIYNIIKDGKVLEETNKKIIGIHVNMKPGRMLFFSAQGSSAACT